MLNLTFPPIIRVFESIYILFHSSNKSETFIKERSEHYCMSKRKKHLIPISEEEIKNWYYNPFSEENTLLKIQEKVCFRAMNKVLNTAPEEQREVIKRFTEKKMTKYPIARDNGSADHLVFLPKEYRQEDYYNSVMNDFYFVLGEDLFPLFHAAIEEGAEDVLVQIKPRFEEYRLAEIDWSKKRRKTIGRWRLNPLEKSLVKKKIARLEGSDPRLKLQRSKLSEAEKNSVVNIIKDFFNNEVSQKNLATYVNTYRDMKTYLQIVPHFVDNVLGKFNGNLIFLDRDARPFYIGAQLFKKFRQDEQALHLVPVTRAMIPGEYTEAHHIEKGSLSPLVHVFANKRNPASYKWEDGRQKVLEDKEAEIEWIRKTYGDELTLKKAMQTSKFKKQGTKLYSFLKHIGAVDAEEITAIDMGLLGTASDFTADVIRQHTPEKKTNSYLFFSSSSVDGFVRKELPYLELDSISYINFYESLPKSIPTVEGFERRENTWVPQYDILSQEESKWIRGIEGEVYLGVKLVEEAIRTSVIKYLFDGQKSEHLIKQRA